MMLKLITADNVKVQEVSVKPVWFDKQLTIQFTYLPHYILIETFISAFLTKVSE